MSEARRREARRQWRSDGEWWVSDLNALVSDLNQMSSLPSWDPSRCSGFDAAFDHLYESRVGRGHEATIILACDVSRLRFLEAELEVRAHITLCTYCGEAIRVLLDYMWPQIRALEDDFARAFNEHRWYHLGWRVDRSGISCTLANCPLRQRLDHLQRHVAETLNLQSMRQQDFHLRLQHVNYQLQPLPEPTCVQTPVQVLEPPPGCDSRFGPGWSSDDGEDV